MKANKCANKMQTGKVYRELFLDGVEGQKVRQSEDAISLDEKGAPRYANFCLKEFRWKLGETVPENYPVGNMVEVGRIELG